MSDPLQLKVYICYGRPDGAPVAREIVAGLRLAGFDAFVDDRDGSGPEWERRRSAQLLSVDAVVFVVSPDALDAPQVVWEANRALELGKRVELVVARPTRSDALPEELAVLDPAISFVKGVSVTQALAELVERLQVDAAWVREHTRYQEMAWQWMQRAEPESLLLRGHDVATAEAWFGARRPGAVKVTDELQAFLGASVDAERQRTSRERQQLEELAAAQQARTAALRAREEKVGRLSRRTVIGGVSLTSFAIVASGLSIWSAVGERRTRIARERAEGERERSVDEYFRLQSARPDLEGQLVAYSGPFGGLRRVGALAPTDVEFTKTVLEELAPPTTSVHAAVARVAQRTLADSRGSQRPSVSNDMNSELWLGQQPATRRRRAIVASVPFSAGTGAEPVERDVLPWGRSLTSWGFQVLRLRGTNKQDLINGLAELSYRTVEEIGAEPTVPSNTLMVFVFAGPGATFDGEEHLLFADSDLTTAGSADASTLSLRQLKTMLRGSAAASVALLDTSFPDIRLEADPPPTPPAKPSGRVRGRGRG